MFVVLYQLNNNNNNNNNNIDNNSQSKKVCQTGFETSHMAENT